jgi:hypothetical protein
MCGSMPSSIVIHATGDPTTGEPEGGAALSTKDDADEASPEESDLSDGSGPLFSMYLDRAMVESWKGC